MEFIEHSDTIDLMLDKINMGAPISFNTSCVLSDGAAAKLEHPTGFLWSIHWMSDMLDGLH